MGDADVRELQPAEGQNGWARAGGGRAGDGDGGGRSLNGGL